MDINNPAGSYRITLLRIEHPCLHVRQSFFSYAFLLDSFDNSLLIFLYSMSYRMIVISELKF